MATKCVDSLFHHPARVYWADTDAGGVVYHAQYLVLLEQARTEWLRTLGYGQHQLKTEYDLVFAVHSMQLAFLQPARLDDALTITVQLLECRRASLRVLQTIVRDGVELVRSEAKLAALSAARFTPCAIPTPLAHCLTSSLPSP